MLRDCLCLFELNGEDLLFKSYLTDKIFYIISSSLNCRPRFILSCHVGYRKIGTNCYALSITSSK